MLAQSGLRHVVTRAFAFATSALVPPDLVHPLVWCHDVSRREHDAAQVLPSPVLAALLYAHRHHAIAPAGLRLYDVPDLDAGSEIDVNGNHHAGGRGGAVTRLA